MLFTSLRGNMISGLSAACVLMVTSLVADVAHGHHSYLMFDVGREVTIEGRLLEFDYTNPHTYITVESRNESGQPAIWEIEGESAIALRRRGISQSDLSMGDRISVTAHPPKNERRRLASGRVITKLDGTELVLLGRAVNGETSAPSVAAIATDLSGTWRAEFGLGQLRSPDIDSWPLTQKGRDALAQYDGSQTPSVNCVPYSAPAGMLIGNMSVEISETAVTIRNREADRILYVDGRSHPERAEPSNQGHSVGRWEDDVLVVDTVDFAEHLIGNAFGVPGGSRKRLTERFALSEDRTEINYSFSLEDPDFLTEPVTGEGQWKYRPDHQFERLPCDPEVARRFLDAL